MVEFIQPAQHGLFDRDAEGADDEWRQHQHHPVVQLVVIDADEGDEGAHHVQGAVGKVDDVQQAEDDSQAEREHRVEGAVDQPQQQLGHQGLQGDSEDFHRHQG